MSFLETGFVHLRGAFPRAVAEGLCDPPFRVPALGPDRGHGLDDPVDQRVRPEQATRWPWRS